MNAFFSRGIFVAQINSLILTFWKIVFDITKNLFELRPFCKKIIKRKTKKKIWKKIWKDSVSFYGVYHQKTFQNPIFKMTQIWVLNDAKSIYSHLKGLASLKSRLFA